MFFMVLILVSVLVACYTPEFKNKSYFCSYYFASQVNVFCFKDYEENHFFLQCASLIL